jgi:hypothetical protein
MTSFTPRPLYPRYALDRRLVRAQSRYPRGGEEKNSHPRRESNPRAPTVLPVTSQYTVPELVLGLRT